MALRHELPECLMGDVDFTQEVRKPVAVNRRPAQVGFRGGADLQAVADAVRDNHIVDVVAACGSGKSVRVPLFLAKQLDSLVIHTVPARNLALSLGDYVSTTTAQTVTTIDDVYTDLPDRGVILMSNVVFLSRFLSNRKGFRTSFILILDESHESDAYTDVLRRTGPTMSMVDKVVYSTATKDPDDFRRTETPGAVVPVFFDDIPVQQWDVEDSGKPWSISNMQGNTVIFVEQRAAVKHLTAAYQENGVNVHVLNAKSSYAAHCAAMEAMQDVKTGLNVLLLDYSYRSGFSIKEISHLIDTGKVVYEDVDESGSHVRRVRDAYKFEIVQAANRAGRFGGTTTTVARPSTRYESKMCDLEGVELDAAALIYRLMGLTPPAAYKGSPFYAGLVPRDPVHALRSLEPLRCLPKSQLVEWVNCDPGCVSREQSGFGEVRRGPKYNRPMVRPTAKLRDPCPSPTFSATDASESVPVATLDAVRDYNARPTAGEAEPYISDEERYERQTGRDSLGRIYDEYAVSNERSRVSTPSYVRSRSVSQNRINSGHSRIISLSTVHSDDDTVDKIADKPVSASRGFEHDFVDALGTVVPCDGVLKPGIYYYHDMCSVAPDKTMTFPMGIDSIMTMLRKDNMPSLTAVMHYKDRAYAVSVLSEAYNEALAEINAIKRLGAGFGELVGERVCTVEKPLLRSWIQGLADILAYRSLQMAAFGQAMVTFTDTGYVELDGMRVLEDKFVESHAHQLHELSQPRVVNGATAYRDRMAGKALVQSPNASLNRYIQDVPYTDDATVVSRRIRDRPRILPGELHVRNMAPSGRGTELIDARYRLQPDSRLRSIFAAPLLRLLGSGNVKMELVR